MNSSCISVEFGSNNSPNLDGRHPPQVTLPSTLFRPLRTSFSLSLLLGGLIYIVELTHFPRVTRDLWCGRSIIVSFINIPIPSDIPTPRPGLNTFCARTPT